ncbi:hypothetical protein [Methylobacterium ajmalii]|uniref:hypothetical protein n=3 Tax=Methylobacteriaceae TaxID=119045 RepID=UPI000B866346|nr:hypothetical protein [Methylobacterium ajmalii]
MSASTEIFETLRLEAAGFTRHVHRTTGARVTPQAMTTFLGEAVKRYVAAGGVAELTDAVVADTCRSITAFCVRQPVRVYSDARQRLFRAMRPKAKAWATANLRAQCAARRDVQVVEVDRVGLGAYVERETTAFVAVPGQACSDKEREAVCAALTQFFGRMKPGQQRPVVRPNRTTVGMQETSYQVETVVGYEDALAAEDGRAARLLSIDAILARLQSDHIVMSGETTPEGLTDVTTTVGLKGVTRASVRGAVERLRGQPRRAAAIDRLPPTARDLVGAIEAELPQNRISVVEVDAVCRKLWAPPRTLEGRRQHVRRLRVAAEAIAAADIALHVAVVGSHVVFGRGRRLPEGEKLQAIVDGALAPKRGRRGVVALSHGLVPARQGLWGTEEGEIAKAVCRVAASQGGHDDVWTTLAAVGKTGAAQDFSTVWDAAGEPVQADSLVLADAVEKAARSDVYGRLSEQAQGGVDLVRTVVNHAREVGLDQAWALYAAKGDMAARLRDMRHAGARERIRRIGAALSKAPCVEAWEAAILVDAYASRPGRRHRHPVVVMPRAPKPVAAPAPAPKPQFYPTYVADAVLSLEMAEEVSMHWSRNRVREAFRALHSVYLGYDVEDTKLVVLDDLPRPSTVEEVTEGMRRILRWWKASEFVMVARVDQDLHGAIQAAIMAAGLALREHGACALYHAASTLSTICIYSSSVEALQGLPRRLSHIQQHLRWSLAQAPSAA